MARYAYERLSAQDATFLWAERDNAPMHVGAVAIFESGPLRNADGGVDFARYRGALESVLHWIPRYRQKLAWTPLEGWPVWVDDRHFDIGYHLRHLSLARPGTLAQLRELASRILARPLDRSRPLWEIWVIEGLEGGDQFALLNKVHHCMIDGAAGANISQILMSPSPNAAIDPPVAYMPRPAPTGGELLLDSLRDRVRRPVAAIQAIQALFEAPEGVSGALGRRGAPRALARRPARLHHAGLRDADQRRAQPAPPARLAHDAARRSARAARRARVHGERSRARDRLGRATAVSVPPPRRREPSSTSASPRRSPRAPTRTSSTTATTCRPGS